MLEDISVERLVYVEESGIDHQMIKENYWAKKGREVVGERNGGARGRTSVIAALNGDEIKAPVRFQGTANSIFFSDWVEQFLLPVLTPRQASCNHG